MYYVISQSTDLRYRDTEIKKFTSKISAIKFSKINSGNFTHENPEAVMNYHHTFKYVYEFSGRIPKKEINKIMSHSSRDYPVYEKDAIARYIYEHGKEVLE